MNLLKFLSENDLTIHLLTKTRTELFSTDTVSQVTVTLNASDEPHHPECIYVGIPENIKHELPLTATATGATVEEALSTMMENLSEKRVGIQTAYSRVPAYRRFVTFGKNYDIEQTIESLKPTGE